MIEPMASWLCSSPQHISSVVLTSQRGTSQGVERRHMGGPGTGGRVWRRPVRRRPGGQTRRRFWEATGVPTIGTH